MIDLKKYITELQSVSIDELTEHSKRFALETLLRELANTVISKNEIKVLHEPKRKDNFGSPDFKIYSQSSIIGYVENKKITENLDKVLKSEQIRKYRELSPNILLTNYLDFVWIKGDNIQKETLCEPSDLGNKNFVPNEEKIQNVINILTQFFSKPPVGVATAKDLALALAIRSRNLKDFLNNDLENQENETEQTRLSGLYETFKSLIFNELTISEFADAFAQMLVYGLFLAKLNANTKEISLYNAKQYIPQSFELIRELVGFLDELEDNNYKDTRWIIDEVISIMNNLNLSELQKTLQFSKKVEDSENIETDPYIYFYETFLAAYDNKLRKAKGVYYTPPQVVSFIVGSLHNVLKNVFNIENGLAQSENVTVLDFATGTGTFIIEILKQIFETLPNNNKQYKEMLIKNHVLKNIYGFEYLIAPYTIAHLKLSQFLKENDYELQDNERFQLYLTNTLEPIADIKPNLYTKALSAEGKLAQKVKDKPILVITGNPPYSGNSKNTGDWITNLLKGNDIWATEKIENQPNYFNVDGKPLGEKNPKWLQDDYVKFIRFAQYKIDRAGEGVVGIITNHSFLDNPTFRGMRQSLMQSFDQLYFIDLHGNAKKKEKTPEGKPDQNVFDIQQGVAISIFVKKKGLKKGVFHADLWGNRKQKFDTCINNTIETLNFTELKPKTPFYLFSPQNLEFWNKYSQFIPITSIFKNYSLGVFTHRDAFLTDLDKTELKNRIIKFRKLENNYEVNNAFGLKDTRDWKINNALQEIKTEDIIIENYSYRPFDIRNVCYNQCMYDRGTSRQHIMNSLIKKGNLALNTSRMTQRQSSFCDVLISNQITDAHYCTGGNYVFPLYLYETQTDTLFKKEEPQKQLSKYEQELKKHTEQFEKAMSEIKRHEDLFLQNNNPTQDEIEYIEEHRSTYEEYKASYEQIKKHYLGLISNSKDEIEQNIENKIEFLDNNIIKRPNFTDDFSKFIKQKYSKTFTPEQIIAYIYAIMHSPPYREKYADFLKLDFPKIPFCDDVNIFEKLSNIGTVLIDSHLLNNIPQGIEFANLALYDGDGDNIVVKPEHKIVRINDKEEERLYFNKTQYFNNVPYKVYDFYIGGYQVLDKYLKDRKGRELNMNEVLNVAKIVKVLSFTLMQMEIIDKETSEWI